MMVTRFEALKAVDDIFNYCEEIDNNLPENERSGYKMLPDIHKIRKYIIENTRPHGEWIYHKEWEFDGKCAFECSKCGMGTDVDYNFCPNCGASMIPSNSEIEKSKSEIEKSKSEIVPDYRDGWSLKEGEAE